MSTLTVTARGRVTLRKEVLRNRIYRVKPSNGCLTQDSSLIPTSAHVTRFNTGAS
jgi:hypothetical protein